MANKNTPVESLETWLSGKPFWEQYVWKLNLDKDSLSDPDLALKIVELHGRLSEVVLAHNRSDQQRENPPDLKDLTAIRKEFDELEANLRASRKVATKGRADRKKEKTTEKVGW